MTNWPEKYNIHPPYTGAELAEPNSRNIQFQYGCNFACDAYRAALNEACNREVLAKIILEAYWPQFYKYEESIEYDKDRTREVADAIRKHLNLVTSAETGKESNGKTDKV